MGTMRADMRDYYNVVDDDYVAFTVQGKKITAGMITERCSNVYGIISPDYVDKEDAEFVALLYKNDNKSRKVANGHTFLLMRKNSIRAAWDNDFIYTAMTGNEYYGFLDQTKLDNPDKSPGYAIIERKPYRGEKEILDIIAKSNTFAKSSLGKLDYKAEPGVPSLKTFIDDLKCWHEKIKNDVGIIPTVEYILKRYNFPGNNHGWITLACFWIYMLSGKKICLISDNAINKGYGVVNEELAQYLMYSVLGN